MNNHAREIGYIDSIYQGVGKVIGLPSVFLHEVLIWENGERAGLVIGFSQSSIEVLFFNPERIDFSKSLFRTKAVFQIPITANYLGRVVNGLGEPIDELGTISGKLTSVFRKAPSIIDREPVKIPLSTGIKVIDITLPLGRGQRELIIGDRKLGKSTLAIDTVLNQKKAHPPVYCIYVICGQERHKLQEMVSLFRRRGAFAYSTIVAATSNDSFASQYLAPFVGCTIGEFFRDQGKDALVIYDDLSKHAKSYRDISLLLERAPGREAYPGDIFSLHAELLERAAKLSKDKDGGSLTALPIAETQEGDITSFISTNLISITDGQIYLERGLFQRGFLPAVNVGLSVSRVGSQAQPKLLKEVTGGIRLALAQHRELQRLVQLETVISKKTQSKIQRSELILTALNQEKHTNISWPEQVVLFFMIEQGFFDNIQKEKWKKSENLLLKFIRNSHSAILREISKAEFNEDIKSKIRKIVDEFKQKFVSLNP